MDSPPSSPPQPKRPKLSTTTTSSSSAPPPHPPQQRPPLPPSSSVSTTSTLKYKRRKIALFFGYCGHGYQGMQKNPNAKTIEADLEEALFLSWAVPESDRGNPRRCDWARSARTDKGVSAVGQVVSGKFYVDPPGLVDRLNSFLDPRIRVFGFKRVTASFNAKKFCDRRRYVYLLPVFALDSAHHGGDVCEECEVKGYEVARRAKVSEEEERGDHGNGKGGLTGLKEEEARVGNAEQEMVEGNGVVDEFILESEKCELGNTGGVDAGVESNFFANGNKMEAGYVAVRSETTKSDAEPCQKVGIEIGDVEIQSRDTNGCPFSLDAEHEHRHIALSVNGSCDKLKEVETQSDACDHVEQIPVITNMFHFGDDVKNRFNSILKQYVGTHNFHNFTSRTKAEDPSAQRYIVSFHANTVIDIGGLEFVKCEVVGQSFMLHQIRKMIGLGVAIMRNYAAESMMDPALSKDVKINVPTAPEIGLYLDECLFTSYNKKWKDHEELSMDSFVELAEDFKMKHIYSHIASMEQKENVVAQWLHELNHHRYYDLHHKGQLNVSTL